MNTQSRTFFATRLTRGTLGLLLLLVFALPFYSCNDDNDETATEGDATLGSLTISVTPATASVVIAGPDSYSKTFTGNLFIADLKPGQYTASATASGFSNAVSQINVVAGHTSSLSLLLLDTPTAAAALGALNININPASATVLVTGPNDFEQSFTGNRLLIDLKPGEYRAVASAPGFGDSTMGINVVVGMTSSLSFVLPAKPIITEAPRAVYRDDKGSLVRLDSITMQSGQFSFHAWLEDNPEGIVPSHITTSP